MSNNERIFRYKFSLSRVLDMKNEAVLCIDIDSFGKLPGVLKTTNQAAALYLQTIFGSIGATEFYFHSNVTATGILGNRANLWQYLQLGTEHRAGTGKQNHAQNFARELFHRPEPIA
nr:hypothetical protein [Microbulbifer sp. NKW57]